MQVRFIYMAETRPHPPEIRSGRADVFLCARRDILDPKQRLPVVRSFTMDIVMIGIGVVFFALFFAYTEACDRL